VTIAIRRRYPDGTKLEHKDMVEGVKWMYALWTGTHGYGDWSASAVGTSCAQEARSVPAMKASMTKIEFERLFDAKLANLWFS
jgi:hypothetical protein